MRDSLTSSHVARTGAIALLAGLAAWQIWSKGLVGGTDRPEIRQTGQEVPDVDVESLKDGRTTDLAELSSEGCVLLYFFDPSCPACRLARGDWEGRTPSVERTSVVWISLAGSRDSTVAFLRDRDIRPPVFQIADSAKAGLGHVGIGATPGTWGIVDGLIRMRRTGRSSTDPEALAADASWCRVNRDPLG